MATERFNAFWHGTELSVLERLCLQSFIDNGHELRLFAYVETAVPPGVELADARQVLPCERLFLFEGSPSAFTNIFRYKLLLEEGGWWVDTDVQCRTGHIPTCSHYWAETDPGTVNGAILKLPAGDALARRLLDLSEQKAPTLARWGQLGPDLLTQVLSRTGIETPASTDDAYPVHWLETHFFWLPEYAEAVRRRVQGSTFLHFWHSMYSRLGIDLTCMPPQGSFLRELYANYGVSQAREDDVATTRGTIKDYLSQDWINTIWSQKFGRRMSELGLSG